MVAALALLAGLLTPDLPAVDLDGDGQPEAVSIDFGDVQDGCARAAELVIGPHRLRLTQSDGVWLGDAAPTAALVPVEVVDLTPKTPDRVLLIQGFPLCDRDYASWIDLRYGQRPALIVALPPGQPPQVIWQATLQGKPLKIRRDGRFDVVTYTCDRPAVRRGDWDDDASVVVKWGRERQVTRRYRLTPEGLKSTVVKERVVRSGCGGTRG